MNEYCAALATCSALSVVNFGRLLCRDPPGLRSWLPKIPSVNISIASTLWPATIGVAPEVPPKPEVQSPLL